MRLTERQEQVIARYVRDVRALVGDLSREERERALERLTGGIMQELKRVSRPNPSDKDVADILSSYGTPETLASRLLGTRPRRGASFVASPDRVWLGVCQEIARRLEMDPNVVRLIVALASVPLFPLAVTAYVATYLYAYFNSDDDGIPKIAWGEVAVWGMGCPATILAVSFGVRAAVAGLFRVFRLIIEQPLVLDNRWLWVERHSGGLMLWALALVTPLAVLSALPLADAWSATLKRVVQAGLAVYAVVLCFGLAGVLVGVTVQLIRAVTQ